jgi:hypothetical protein
MTELGEAVAVAVPAVPQTPPKALKVRFDKGEARCGDVVTAMAQATEIPDGTKVEFELNTGKGTAIVTLSESLLAAQARKPWESKKLSDDWSDAKVILKGSAGGVSATADSELEIKKYANIASATKTIPCKSSHWGWDGKFDIELKDGVIHVTTKVKLINRQGAKPGPTDAMPAAGAAVSDADKAAMVADIEGKLTDKNYLHREKCARSDKCDCPRSRACCKLTVQIHVQFVESGEHHTVNLFQGAGRANATNWTRTKTRDNSWAHETGHLLGWYDEYSTGAVGAAPRWEPNRTTAIMNVGLEVPPEYYQDFGAWVGAQVAESWKALKV